VQQVSRKRKPVLTIKREGQERKKEGRKREKRAEEWGNMDKGEGSTKRGGKWEELTRI